MGEFREEKAESIFQQALDLPPARRSEFLQENCGSSSDLRREVEALLAHYEQGAGAFPEGPVFSSNLEEGGDPLTVGPYRIIGRLGEGGMGIVYEAEQERPRRSIAIKVLRPGLYGERQLKRFRLECEVLGQLSHPGIAHIYEAGDAEATFAQGRNARLPYLAMELVPGRRLLEHVETAGLDRPSRLELFTLICDAVHYAHQQAVVHRDLKPGNILVDDADRPKVLDFGVARFLTQDTGMTQQTRTGDLIGTLHYMSPEQLIGNQSDVDIRTDIYALGVILYELLAGRPPYELSTGSITDLVLRIESGDMPRLSAQEPSLRGDLESIVVMALSPKREDRYPSAASLGEDVRRYLKGEPVSARSAGVWSSLIRIGRRHRRAAAVAAMFILLVVGSSVVAWTLYTQARQAKSVAHRERNEARERLYESLIAGATAERIAGRRGKRTNTLSTLEKAAEIHPSIEVRDGAIASLAHSDLELERTFETEGWVSASVTGDLLAHSAPVGVTRILRLPDLQEVTRVQGPNLPVHLQKLSEDGRYLVAKYHPVSFSQDEVQCWLWDLHENRPLLKLESGQFLHGEAAYGTSRSGRRWVAWVEVDHYIRVYDLTTTTLWRELGPCEAISLATSPDRHRLATVSLDGRLSLWDVESGKETVCQIGFRATRVLWPQNDHLIVSGSEGGIYVWDLPTKGVVASMSGHQNWVSRLYLGPDGQTLASGSWDTTTRLWNIHTERETIAPLHNEKLSGFGERLVTYRQQETRIYRVVPSRTCRDIHTGNGFAGPATAMSHPEDDIVLTASKAGLQVWEIGTGRLLFHDPTPETMYAEFQGESGNRIVAFRDNSLVMWPFEHVDGLVSLGDAVTFWAGGPFTGGGGRLDPTGSKMMVATPSEVVTLSVTDGRRGPAYDGYPGIGEPTLHPDGRFALTGMWRRGPARIWDLESGETLRTFDGVQVTGEFTRDGRYLFVSDGPSVICLDVGTWDERYRIEETGRLRLATRPRFSPDGEILAFTGDFDIRLFDVETGARLATLTPPERIQLSAICFTPDGTRIVATSPDRRIQVWDLSVMKQKLGEMGLDWDAEG